MKKLLRLMSMIGAWATARLEAIERAERVRRAIPAATRVKLSRCPCSGSHGGIWKIESYNPEADDYRLVHELTGRTTIAMGDALEVYNPSESS